MLFHVEQFGRIQLCKSGEKTRPFRLIHMRVVVARADGEGTINPADDVAAVIRFNCAHMAAPGGIAAGEVDQDAVETVALLELNQGLCEGLCGVPDLYSSKSGIQE